MYLILFPTIYLLEILLLLIDSTIPEFDSFSDVEQNVDRLLRFYHSNNHEIYVPEFAENLNTFAQKTARAFTLIDLLYHSFYLLLQAFLSCTFRLV